jgi:hypothetical protein
MTCLGNAAPSAGRSVAGGLTHAICIGRPPRFIRHSLSSNDRTCRNDSRQDTSRDMSYGSYLQTGQTRRDIGCNDHQRDPCNDP